MAKTFREVWKWLLPRNIAKPEQTDDEGALVAQSLTTVIDTTLTRAREGLNARLPTRAGASANELTAGDRGILRGRAETADAFAARLVAWRTPRTHKVRGNAYELLEQIWTYWGGVKCSTIANGYACTKQVSGGLSKTARSWNYTTAWARFWVLAYLGADNGVDFQPDLGDATLWGGALGTPGYTLGQTGVTPADVLAMRNLFQQYAWHPEHALPEWLILVVALEPSSIADHWSYLDSDTQRAARNSVARYWSLDPARNNVYSGDPTSWATYTETDALGTYGPGDPTNAAAWGAIALPNGETYTGDPSSFPVDVLLMDDGSTPA